jgi:DNA modification methylase
MDVTFRNQILIGDCREGMRSVPDGCAQSVVTSPPYWGQRDYKMPPVVWGGDSSCDHQWGRMERGKRKDILPADQTTLTSRTGSDDRQNGAATNGGRFCSKCDAWLGCYGNEPTPELYVRNTVLIFREVKRLLRGDGTLWLNLGDSYQSGKGMSGGAKKFAAGTHTTDKKNPARRFGVRPNDLPIEGLKPKDLVGIPWMVAFALRADGWYLRQDIIWWKPNATPSSVEDRCTSSHEYLFLLTKSRRYFYDHEAIKEPSVYASSGRESKKRGEFSGKNQDPGKEAFRAITETKNKRSVWRIPTSPYRDAHFAVFPPKLVEPCILAGTSADGCCSSCGAPRVRITRKVTIKRDRPNARTSRHAEGDGVNACSNTVAGVRVETLGWEPSCTCGTSAMPCLVFDPFGGSGTTAQVAQHLGRDWLITELNPDYAALAEKRIATPLKAGKSPKPAPVQHGQRFLFTEEIA